MTQREREVLRLLEAEPMISQRRLAEKLGITRSSAAVHISNLMKKGYIVGKGYVLHSGTYAAVVGGVNVDIGGRSAGPLVAADSNPGSVRLSLGGVGRNIAHNLALLGRDVRLLTAFGRDLYGRQVAASCEELGIDISHALQPADGATSVYLYISGPEGEMALALSDMEICRRITPDYLAGNLPLLQNARAVVADANLPAESLRYLAENCPQGLFCDPVSTAKAEKLLPILPKIHTLKPNRLEAEVLTGVSIRDAAGGRLAARTLLDKGVKRVFLSLGARGVLAAEGDHMLLLPSLKGRPVSTTGCGDAFMAGLVWAYLEDLDLAEAAQAGLAAASIAMESEQTINPALSADVLRQRMAAKADL